MDITNKARGRDGEQGNVLFLILIAVALFAALSYAVTQSTRSGAGDTASETNLISSAQLTQYPAGIRTSVVRMLIGGVAVEDLLFNSPSDFGSGQLIDTTPEAERAVFHPNGGNATYQLAPNDVVSQAVTGEPLGKWFYNAEAQIQNIGLTNGGGGAGNDVIAWLPYVTNGICRRINEELGISGVPAESAITIAAIATDMDDPTTSEFPVADGPVIDGDGGSTPLSGQPFGCFTDGGGENIYYHVLIER